MVENNKLKIAFVVGEFPVVSETFIINQVADLLDKGMEIEIFSFNHGDESKVSQRYFEYKMREKVHYLEMPKSYFSRLTGAFKIKLRLLLSRPLIFLRAVNVFKYGRNALSFKLLFWSAPFVGKDFDLVHCHFGTIAKRFLQIREITGLKAPIITSFYGYDVSHIVKQKGKDYYQALDKVCERYLVMSNNMKERVAALGISPDKIEVLPVSIKTEEYPFAERRLKEDEPLKIFSVGRFVEKKGFDDLLRALAIVKERGINFICDIVGGGPMEAELQKMTDDLKLRERVNFLGYLKIEEVIKKFMEMHLFIQPSKTAKDGDME